MNLQVINHNGIEVVESREVSDMIGKQHAHLMRDIKGYSEILKNSTESSFGLSDFFIPHTYTDSTGRTLPCYLITKKGCDMVANKMTGEKGVLFTAAYVTAFEKMREVLAEKKPMTAAQMFAMQAQVNLEQEQRLALMEKKTDYLSDSVKQLCKPVISGDTWQHEMLRRVRSLCEEYDLNYQQFITDLYKELEESAGVNLETRQKRKRERLELQGAKYAERQAVSKLSIIADDRKLREILSGIVQNHAAALVVSKMPMA